MEGLVLRLLGPENVMDAHAVWRDAGLVYHASGRDSVSRMTKELKDPRTILVGAFVGEALLGVVLGTDDGRKGWINRLAVRPAYRRKGIAHALVDFCERQFKARGIGILAVLIEEDNVTSRELFLKEGYEARPDIQYYRKLTGGPDW